MMIFKFYGNPGRIDRIQDDWSVGCRSDLYYTIFMQGPSIICGLAILIAGITHYLLLNEALIPQNKRWGERPDSEEVSPFTVPIDHWAEKDLQNRLSAYREGSFLEEVQVSS